MHDKRVLLNRFKVRRVGVWDGCDGLIGDRVLIGHDLGELVESCVELGSEFFVVLL